MLIINKYWERPENKEIREIKKEIKEVKEVEIDLISPIFTEIYEILDKMESRINEV